MKWAKTAAFASGVALGAVIAVLVCTSAAVRYEDTVANIGDRTIIVRQDRMTGEYSLTMLGAGKRWLKFSEFSLAEMRAKQAAEKWTPPPEAKLVEPEAAP